MHELIWVIIILGSIFSGFLSYSIDSVQVGDYVKRPISSFFIGFAVMLVPLIILMISLHTLFPA